MDEPETELRGPAVASCPACGRNPRWEPLQDGEEERWLALCRCGRMRVFLPEQPALDPEDPVRAFLVGVGWLEQPGRPSRARPWPPLGRFPKLMSGRLVSNPPKVIRRAPAPRPAPESVIAATSGHVTPSGPERMSRYRVRLGAQCPCGFAPMG